MASQPRGFPVHPTRFWGGSADVCKHVVGIIPHHGEPHLMDLECDGMALSKCLCGMASPKDKWHCGDEGTSPFNYFLWKHMPTDPVDKYPLNETITVKGEQIRGCVILIKLDRPPSNNADIADMTMEELNSFIAVNPFV